jgi:hypothetical protein
MPALPMKFIMPFDLLKLLNLGVRGVDQVYISPPAPRQEKE